MTHKPQPGADAYALAAENAQLARAVTRMGGMLRNLNGLLHMLAWQDEPLAVTWTSTDGYYQPVGGDAREIAQHEISVITELLEREREAIELAARVWPPTAEQGRG